MPAIRHAQPRAQAGVALLEALVALGLLAGVLVSLAGLSVIAARSNREARSTSLMSIAATQKMEQLRGLSWAYGEDGQDEVDLSTDLSASRETGGGAGLSPSPPGTLEANVAGYVDYLDDHGSWVGYGASPPPTACYARRWSIEPLADSPLDTLVLRVVVVPVAGPSGGRPTEGRDGSVSLTTVRSRRSR